MLCLASVHPAPRRALKRVIKNQRKRVPIEGDSSDGNEHDSDDDEVRDAANVACAASIETTSAQRAAVKQEDVKDEQDAAWDSASDSDYNWDDGASDELASSEQDEEEDSGEHRRALQAELDECADDGHDVYLERMLAVRERLEGDDAAWVDRYIALQQQWKDRHAFSIDAFDLAVKLKPRALARAATTKQRHKTLSNRKTRTKTNARRSGKQRVRRPYSHCLRAFWRVWYTHVAPRLPLELQEERAEYVLALLTALAFVVLSLAIQLYAGLRAVVPGTASEGHVDD